MLITVVLFPDVFFVCLVIILGRWFTLSFRILESFVVAFAKKCVFIPCAACFQRHTWTKMDEFFFLYDFRTCLFFLLVQFYALYWKTVCYWLKQWSCSQEKGNIGTRCPCADQDLTRLLHTHLIKTDFHMEERFKKKKKSLSIFPLVKYP